MLRAASQGALHGQGYTHSVWIDNQERQERGHKVDAHIQGLSRVT